MARRLPPRDAASRIATIAVLCALACSPPAIGQAQQKAASASQPPGANWDFEADSLFGWSKTGTAFDFQPACGDNPAARGAGSAALHLRRWIGTFERYRCRQGETPGAIQGDRPTGTLTSARFRIQSPYITFLVGGGSSESTSVVLRGPGFVGPAAIVPGPVLRMPASGRNSETMRRVYWDVSDLLNTTAQLEIRDLSSSRWGHINVDDFRFAATPPADGELLTVRTVVPRLIGLNQGSAMTRLKRARLGPGTVSTRGGQVALQRDSIIDQSPKEGATASPGERVNYTLDAWVVVPDLTNQPWSQARRSILDSRLRPLPPITPAGGTLETARVGSQQPRPGERAISGDPVGVVLVAPAPAIRDTTVPRLQGLAAAAARASVEGAGLVWARPRADTSAPDGIVANQQPPAGTRVRLKSEVTAWIGTLVEVPDVYGFRFRAADSTIRAAGLRARVGARRDTTLEPDLVLLEVPEEGTLRPRGSIVTLTLSGPATAPPAKSGSRVIVPDLAGLPAGAAADTVRLRGLLPEFRDTLDAPGKPGGTVVGQSPPAGKPVRPHSPVYMDLAKRRGFPWKQVGALALAWAAGFGTPWVWSKVAPPQPKANSPTPPPPDPSFTVQLNPHPERSRLELGAGPSTALDWTIAFRVDPGTQAVDPSLAPLREEKES